MCIREQPLSFVLATTLCGSLLQAIAINPSNRIQELQQAKQDLQTAQGQLQQADTAVANAQKEVATAQAKATQAATDLQNATNANDAAQAAATAAQKALDTAKNDVTTLEGTLQQKEADAQQAENAFNQATQADADAKQKVLDAQTDLQQKKGTGDEQAAQEALTKAEEAAKEAETKLQAATQANNDAKQAVTDAQSDLNTAKGQVTTLEGTLQQKQAAAQQTNQDLQTATQADTDAKNALTKAQGTLQTAQGQQTTAQNNVNKLQTQVAQIQGQVNNQNQNQQASSGGLGGSGGVAGSSGAGGPVASAPMPSKTPAPKPPTPAQTAQNALQTLVSGKGGATTLTQALSQYKANEAKVVATTTSGLINNVTGMSNTQAVSGLVAGLNQYAGGNLVNNPSVGTNLTQALTNFYTLASAANISINALNNSLNNLIELVQNLQTSLLNQLAVPNNVVGAIHTPAARVRGITLVALLPKQSGPLTPQQRAQMGEALEHLSNLLAYLNATKSKLGSYIQLNPLSVGPGKMVASSTQSFSQNGNMYGVNAQLGYKQFFGKKKRWGLRYYGSFSYQHGVFASGSSPVNNFVYGAGVDALYNFYESQDSKYTSGVFVGAILAGSTWVVPGESTMRASMEAIKARGGSASMNTTYFQIPLNIGFRTNVSRHSGFEVGLRIPLAMNAYFKGDFKTLYQKPHSSKCVAFVLASGMNA
ncbi:outer membrane protein, partial [Helicobacter salomonis]|uniref:outer membrane protein n=1 Tax=Helicobacter salomonis TaxID=56878 RepID=UPI001F2C45C9